MANTERCAIHDVDEPWEPGDFACGECYHVFKTGELMKEYNALVSEWEGKKVTSDGEVYTCPICAHDL